MVEAAEQLIVGYLSGEPVAQRRVADWVEKWAAPFLGPLGSRLSEVVAEAHDELASSFHRGRFQGEEALEPYIARIVRGRSIARWRSEETGREAIIGGTKTHPPVDQLIDFADGLPMGLVERELITDHLIDCRLCVESLELARQPATQQPEGASAEASAGGVRFEGGDSVATVAAVATEPRVGTDDTGPSHGLLDRAVVAWAVVASLVALALAGGWLASFQQLRQVAGDRRETAQQVEQLIAEREQLLARATEAEVRLAAADQVLASRGAFELRQGGALLELESVRGDSRSPLARVELRSDHRGNLVLVLRSTAEVPAEDAILTLTDPGGRRLWSLRGPRRDAQVGGYVLLVPSARLAEGRFQIDLAPQPDQVPVATYRFEITRDG